MRFRGNNCYASLRAGLIGLRFLILSCKYCAQAEED